MNRRALLWALMVAIPLVWQNERVMARERERRELVRLRLVIVPESDSLRFAVCKQWGGFINEDSPRLCEHRP